MEAGREGIKGKHVVFESLSYIYFIQDIKRFLSINSIIMIAMKD